MNFGIVRSIKRVSIINANSGIEIYNKNFMPSFFLEHDAQLISGFISAIIAFSKTIVKDEVQELVFANSKLFINPLPSIIVVVMTPLGVDKQSVLQFIHELENKIEANMNITARLDFITPKLRASFEKIMNEILELESMPASSPTPPDKPDKSPKIVIAGLKKAGKTTVMRKFFYSWDKEQLQTIKPTVDYSIFHSFIDVLRTDLTIFDLGGQPQYVANHLATEIRWKGSVAIIFLVDILKPDEFTEAYEYLIKIIEILEVNKEEPFIGLFAHKYDPDKKDQLQPNLKKFLEIFRGIFRWPRYSIFLSSIYDDSIHLAFMRSLLRIVPRDLIQNLLESAIFFETQNQVWKSISKLINLESDPQELRENVITLATPYGEKLANKIFSDWLAGDTIKYVNVPTINPLTVIVTDTQAGFRVDVSMPKKNSSSVILDVTEGLLTGLSNIFGLSSIVRVKSDEEGEIVSSSWTLFET